MPKVVWDTSSGGQVERCKKCGKARCVCQRASREVVPGDVTARVRLDTKKRAGKAVTVVEQLPHNPTYWKKLLKELKSHLGTGGAYKKDTGHLEVQGDQREKVAAFLEGRGFGVRRG